LLRSDISGDNSGKSAARAPHKVECKTDGKPNHP
jgi:hypothetical protein